MASAQLAPIVAAITLAFVAMGAAGFFNRPRGRGAEGAWQPLAVWPL